MDAELRCMSMSEIKLSNEVRTVIGHFYSKLASGEKVLLWGRGKVMQNPLRRTATFGALLIFILLFPVPFILIFCQATIYAVARVQEFLWLPDFVIAVGAVIETSAIFAMCLNFVGSGFVWHVLTSERLLRVERNGKVKTIAARADVGRIEASGAFTNLFVDSSSTQDKFEVSICQVRGLPELMGGQTPAWLIQHKKIDA